MNDWVTTFCTALGFCPPKNEVSLRLGGQPVGIVRPCVELPVCVVLCGLSKCSIVCSH